MRICLLGSKGIFNSTQGTGIKRYASEIYKNINNTEGITIEKIEGILPPTHINFFIENSFRYFGSFDIVHSIGQRFFIPLNKGKAKILITAHDFRPLVDKSYKFEVEEAHISSFRNLMIIKGMKQCLKVNHLIAVSTQTRDEAISLGYQKSNITVIPQGLDPRFLQQLKNEKDMDGKSKFRCGYVGSFAHHKNISSAINAFGLIRQNDIDFELWGNYKYVSKGILRGIGNDKRIRLMGFAEDKDIIKTYDRFDALIFPSLYEGFGLPILEAQARGLPVIIFKKSRIPSEVRKYCLEADSLHDMAKIITDLKENGYCARRKKEALRYATSFTWKKTAEKTIKAYKNIVE